MVLIYFVLSFISGTALGSFLGVLVDRLPRQESIGGRSKCESCKKTLQAIDLIPIFSYLALSGKCRSCHAKFSPRLLFIEILGGFTCLGLFLYANNLQLGPLLFAFLVVVMFSFIGIFLADLIYGIIPDEFIIAIIASTLIVLVATRQDLLVEYFVTGFVSFFLFLALYFVTRGRGMGFGDVKLVFAIGFFLGFPRIIVSLYAAFLTAMVISIILILLRKKKLKGGTIPFGPFLSFGAVFAYFFGTRIIEYFFK